MPNPPTLLPCLLLLLALQTHTISFSATLPYLERFCFYEVFELQQKYTLVTEAHERAKYEVEVSHIDGRQWKSVFFRTVEDHDTLIRVDKLASSSTTYSFCLKNLDSNEQSFHILFNTGLDVLQLHNLPDSTDADNLERQLNWLEKQTESLTERSENLEGLRRINVQIHDMVGIKMIVFALLGLLAIGGVNVVFYRLLRSELKRRKLI